MTDFNYDTIDYSNDQVSQAELTLRKRQAIKAAAGDSESMQGSVADCAQITMLAMGKLLDGLKNGRSVDDIIASDPVFSACIAYAETYHSGEMKVPFEQKPEGEAMSDLIARTHSVAELY